VLFFPERFRYYVYYCDFDKENNNIPGGERVLLIYCALTYSQEKSGTVAIVPQRTTYNYVNCHCFMALSHTLYVIKVFLSKKDKSLNPLYFGLSHMSVSSDRQLRNAGLRPSLSLFIH
jgi:hypothetical protein